MKRWMGQWGWILATVFLVVVGPPAGWAATATNIFPPTGNAGIGTTTPLAALQIGSSADVAGKKLQLTSNSGSFYFYIQGSTDSGTHAGVGRGIKIYTPSATAYPLVISQSAAQPIVFGTTDQERMRITSTGNVGIGTTAPTKKLDVHGDINVTGNINAKYQDVAEWVPTKAKAALPAGTVVVIDPQATNEVLPAAQPYDTRVAGVVSARPGLLLGEEGEGKVKVAHMGRVAVKVDASYAPIAVGDLLVTSPTEGYAMRSTPVDLGGVQIHRPGTLVGKALEPLANGQGEILVLLTLQ